MCIIEVFPTLPWTKFGETLERNFSIKVVWLLSLPCWLCFTLKVYLLLSTAISNGAFYVEEIHPGYDGGMKIGSMGFDV